LVTRADTSLEVAAISPNRHTRLPLLRHGTQADGFKQRIEIGPKHRWSAAGLQECSSRIAAMALCPFEVKQL
jgi:hypothetical protein